MSTRAQWLTAKRLRAHGVLLGVALWSIYLWTLATPGLLDRNSNLKGTDFLHFYTLGALANARDGVHLYDMDVQAALAAKRVPDASGIRYLPLYPPQTSLLFVPFARMPYPSALSVWWTISAALYGICCVAIWRACPNLHDYGSLVLILALAFPAFFNLIAWGQTSALALACFTFAFRQLRQGKQFIAGMALGLLAFKPQLGIAVAIVFLVSGNWRLISGAILSAAAEFSAGAIFYGMEPLRRWITQIRHVGSVMPWLEPKLYQTHCLRTFWSMLVPWTPASTCLYAISALAVIFLACALWRRGDRIPLSLRYSALLLATVLISPHLTVYDLVILAPAILLLADWAVADAPGRGTLGKLLYFVYVLPLVGPLARWTHLQLSVIAMAALLWTIWQASRGLDPTQIQPLPKGHATPVSIPARSG